MKWKKFNRHIKHIDQAVSTALTGASLATIHTFPNNKTKPQTKTFSQSMFLILLQMSTTYWELHYSYFTWNMYTRPPYSLFSTKLHTVLPTCSREPQAGLEPLPCSLWCQIMVSLLKYFCFTGVGWFEFHFFNTALTVTSKKLRVLIPLHSEGLKNRNQPKYHNTFKPVSALKPEHKDKAELNSFP